MANTLENLLQSIVDANTSFLRVNDIRVKTGSIFTFGMKKFTKADKTEDASPCLVDEKHNQFAGSVNQFASMRIAKGVIKAEWHEEFLNEVDGDVFKHVASDLITNGVDIKTIKLKAVHQLKMLNKFSSKPNVPIYKDYCYEGHLAFSKAKFELKLGKDANYTSTPEYRSKMYELGNELHSTALIAGRDIEANIEYLPVFELIG